VLGNATTGAFADITGLNANDSVFYTITVRDGDTVKDYEIELVLGADQKTLSYNGNTVGAAAATAGTQTAAEQGAALVAAINSDPDLKGIFTASYATGALTLTNKTAGADQPSVLSMVAPSGAGGATDRSTVAVVTAGEDSYQQTKVTDGEVFTVNGKKFMMTNDNDTAKAADSDVTVVIGDPTDADDLAKLAAAIKQQTGYEPTVGEVETGAQGLQWKADTTSGKDGNGLKLQIGDTSEEWNQMTVSIGDMHATSIGIGNISVAKQEDAQAAISIIKNAINTVSSTRGDLGAIQNRL
jgi:flagellin